MATKQSTIDYLLEQVAKAGSVSARKMFGEYALYCDGKVVALVCDDELYLKPTKVGLAFLGEVVKAPPYSGAKDYYLITGDQWEDAEWLVNLIRISMTEIPLPKPKKKK